MLASTSWRGARLLKGAAPLLESSRELLLECGAGVRLQCFASSPPEPRGPPVVLLHGWEGSADSLHVLSLAQRLFARGFKGRRPHRHDYGAPRPSNHELFPSLLP